MTDDNTKQTAQKSYRAIKQYEQHIRSYKEIIGSIIFSVVIVLIVLPLTFINPTGGAVILFFITVAIFMTVYLLKSIKTFRDCVEFLEQVEMITREEKTQILKYHNYIDPKILYKRHKQRFPDFADKDKLNNSNDKV